MITQMAFALQLTHDEPRLVYLAVRYHLARPGSELDAETKQPAQHGLGDVEAELREHLDGSPAVIGLDEHQYRRLLSAIYGAVNELRVMHMGSGIGAVPGFADEARLLFPELASDADAALALSESMMMLHRRMDRAVARAATEAEAPGEVRQRNAPPRRWWRRGGRRDTN